MSSGANCKRPRRKAPECSKLPGSHPDGHTPQVDGATATFARTQPPLFVETAHSGIGPIQMAFIRSTAIKVTCTSHGAADTNSADFGHALHTHKETHQPSAAKTPCRPYTPKTRTLLNSAQARGRWPYDSCTATPANSHVRHLARGRAGAWAMVLPNSEIYGRMRKEQDGWHNSRCSEDKDHGSRAAHRKKNWQQHGPRVASHEFTLFIHSDVAPGLRAARVALRALLYLHMNARMSFRPGRNGKYCWDQL